MRYLVDGVERELASVPGVVVTSDGERLTVAGLGSAIVRRHKGKILVSINGLSHIIEPIKRGAALQARSSGELKSSLPGTVVDVLVSVGDSVKSGDKLVVLEAMKMQMPLIAPFNGTVSELAVAKGQQVAEGTVIVVVQPEGTASA